MINPLEVKARNSRRNWSVAEVSRLLGANLAAGWALASTVASEGPEGDGLFDLVFEVRRLSDGRYQACEKTLTSWQVIGEGTEADVQAQGTTYLINAHGVSMDFLLASVQGQANARAFRNGLHIAADMLPRLAAQRGISGQAAHDLARDICEQLGLPRACDLREQMLARHWQDDAVCAVSNIHHQLMAIGCPGLSMEDAEAIVRGGPDARAGLDRMEAEQGIDVSVMREAITYVPHDYPSNDLESLCEAHELIVRRGLGEDASSPDGLPQWEWVSADGAQVSNLYFGSEREARIAALEEKLLPEWFAAGQYEMDFPDFMEAARPGSSNRP